MRIAYSAACLRYFVLHFVPHQTRIYSDNVQRIEKEKREGDSILQTVFYTQYFLKISVSFHVFSILSPRSI